MTPDNSPDDQPVDAANTDPMLLKVLNFIQYCRTLEYTTGAGTIPDEALARRDIKVQADAIYKELDAIKWGVTAAPVNQPDTLEVMLARVPIHYRWKLMDVGGEYLAAIGERGKFGNSVQGRGPTPTAALKAALAKIGEVG